MLYRDIKDIGLKWHEPEESIQRLQNEFEIDAPISVIRQFYIDHSSSSEFIELYGDINLHNIKWSLIELPTKVLLDIGDAATHPQYVIEVSESAKHYNSYGDSAIHVVPNVAKHWKANGTWDTPPVFVDGTNLKVPTERFHLAEGHTRLGCLQGVWNEKIIEVAEFHKVYYGEI